MSLPELVHQLGYLIVFLAVGIESMGVPVPGETTLLIAAVAAGHGNLSPVGVGIVGWIGAVTGDNCGFWIGRRWGTRLLTLRWVKRWYTPTRVARAEKMVARRGVQAVFFARFVALLRILAGPLAGMHRMSWPRFLIANATGAAVWVTVVMIVGTVLGAHLDEALSLVSHFEWIALAVVALGIAGYVVWRRRWLAGSGRS